MEEKNTETKAGEELPYNVIALFCSRCKHMWKPRQNKMPKTCPQCKNPKLDVVKGF